MGATVDIDPHEGSADMRRVLAALGLDGAPDATRHAAWEGVLARLYPQD